MKRTNVLQALIFSIVILFGGTACDNANDERFSSTEEFTVEGDASSIEIPMTGLWLPLCIRMEAS